MLSQYFWNSNDQQLNERLDELFIQKSFQLSHSIIYATTQDQILIPISLICVYFAYKTLLNFATWIDQKILWQ